jgi:bile acid:Na+ symporter, BASS family
VDLLFLVLNASVAVIVFGYALGADPDDIRYLLHRPRLLLVSLLAMFLVMPVLALALDVYTDFPHATRVALVVIALSPVPQLIPRNQISLGGRSAYAYGLTRVVAVLSIVIVPFLVDFIGRLVGRPLALEPGAVAEVLLPTIVLPVLLGSLVARVAPRVARRLHDRLIKVADVVFTVALLVLLVLVLPVALGALDVGTVLAIAVFVLAGLALGHVLAGPDPDDSVVLAVACATRYPATAIAIASANLPDEEVVPVIVLYALVNGLIATPYVRWQKRRLARTQAAPVADGSA